MSRSDGVWFIILVALLVGWWIDRDATTSQSVGLKQQIQQLQTSPPQIKFVNADFSSALMFLEMKQQWSHKRKIKIQQDVVSLKQAGVLGRGSREVTANVNFEEETIPQMIEKMAPGKVVVTETPEGFLVSGKVD